MNKKCIGGPFLKRMLEIVRRIAIKPVYYIASAASSTHDKHRANPDYNSTISEQDLITCIKKAQNQNPHFLLDVFNNYTISELERTIKYLNVFALEMQHYRDRVIATKSLFTNLLRNHDDKSALGK